MPVTVAKLLEDSQMSLADLVQKTGLDEGRVAAIVEGRWTPSPQERRRIAEALGAAVEEIVWGHKTPIQHLWGHGPT